jgi:hypothetical protein
MDFLLFLATTLGFALLSVILGLSLAWSERGHLWDWFLQGAFAGLQMSVITWLARSGEAPVTRLLFNGLIGFVAFAFLYQLYALWTMFKEDRKNHLGKKKH